MLRSRNLPWRAILHNPSSNRVALRHSLSAACRISPAQSAHAQHLNHSNSAGYPLLYGANSRCFSSTPARRKEKPPSSDDGKPEDETAEEGDKDKKGKDEENDKGKLVPDEQTQSEEKQPSKTRREKKSKKDTQQQQSPPPPEETSNKEPPEPSPIPPSATASSPSTATSPNDAPKKPGRKSNAEKALQKPSVPEIYPTVMAIPIARRPLFPGFYKAITIRDPNVIAAIEEMSKRGQPYVGAFLLKDENADKDVIESMDEVHDVGVFAQITSTFPVHHGENPGMTAVLYPHRRIKMTELVDANAVAEKAKKKSEEGEAAKTDAEREKEKDTTPVAEVASFEEKINGKSEIAVKYDPTAFLRNRHVSIVNVTNLREEPFDQKSPIIRAVTSEIINVFKDVANLNPLFRDQISTFSMSQSAGNITEEPAKLADFAAAVSAGELHELQDVLTTMNVEDRLSKALVVLKKELMNAQLQSKISRDVEAKIQKRQREYWLMEQMKGIRRELGIETDGKDKLVENFREKANKLAMPDTVKKVFDEELNKLAHLEPAASEFNVTRNYLDWITQIPWGIKSKENFSIKNAMTVLDEDHYGLKDVKDRILEFIAVGKLRGTVEGKILCFVGPPGVGKTSIGKSIARALNREYYRFSVGGLTDVAEIKGHRRTYVGALPGRIIQALKKCQTENPLILIDEVDKIGRGHQGDPSSALLELLDPEQNSSFLDHYLDVPVDLSKVLFVCTANMTDTIPRPLLDRMEMIELSGYVADEKMAIAEKYLAPAAKEISGLKDVDVTLEKGVMEELIKSYCRESGVRNLKKQIEKVYRKAALKIIRDLPEEELEPAKEEKEASQSTAKTEKDSTTEIESKPEDATTTTTENTVVPPPPDSEHPTEKEDATHIKPARIPPGTQITISHSNLKDYVGPPIFTADRLYETTPPGVVMGLAWTSMGGAALYVESILENALTPKSQPGFEQTGNLMTVMKESTVIAYSFAKSLMAREFPSNKFFEKGKIHLHCPEGAVQKDGMS